MPRYYNALSSILIVALSFALWTSRRSGAEWRAELVQSTENFVAGARPPAITLHARDRTIRLDSLCDGRKPMLVYFHRSDCPACAQLDKRWGQLGGEADAALHQIHLDGLPSESSASTSAVSHWTASPISVLREARVQMVPAVVAIGRDCEVEAAGAGVHAAALVMRRFAGKAGR
jgi:hypothetical protein